MAPLTLLTSGSSLSPPVGGRVCAATPLSWYPSSPLSPHTLTPSPLSPLSPTPLQGGPSGRSCHKMCLDIDSQVLYLLGRYLGPTSRTQFNSSAESSPLPVMLPPASRCPVGHMPSLLLPPPSLLSLLLPPHPQGDFYSYCIDTQTWQQLSSNTHRDGGPHLIYDHQMAFDPTTCIIYVFGGRVLTS